MKQQCRRSERIAKQKIDSKARTESSAQEEIAEEGAEMSNQDDLNQTLVDFDPSTSTVATLAQQVKSLVSAVSTMSSQMSKIQDQLSARQSEDIHGAASTASSIAQPDRSPDPSRVPPNAPYINQSLEQFNFSATNLGHKLYDLPTFTGDPEQWPVFYAAYRQSTNAFKYSALQNTFRLQKALIGEARECVEYLLLNPDNVDDLIQTLHFRFGRPEILVQSQMARVRNMREISERQTDQIVFFSTKVTNLVAFLNNEDSRHVLGETTLLAELVSKLPPTKRFDWTRESLTIKPRATIIEFAAWLKSVAECVSLLKTQMLLQQPAEQSRNVNQDGRQGRHVLNVSQANTRVNCGVCDRAHAVVDCNRFRKATWQEKFETAKRLRLCFSCLQTGHMSHECHDRRQCPINGCTFEHNELMHKYSAIDPARDTGRRDAQRDDDSQQTTNVSAPVTTSSSSMGRRGTPFDEPSSVDRILLSCKQTTGGQPPLFRILPVTLYGPEREIDTYALLDDGSALTLIDEQLSRYLQLEGHEGSLNVQWFGRHSSSEPSRHVQLKISGASQRHYELHAVRTVRDINLPAQSLVLAQLNKNQQHLPVAEYRDARPKILIGLDNAHLGMALRTHTSSEGGPIAVQTRLGWVAYGARNANSPAYMLHITEVERWEYLDRVIREFYTTENFGVKRPEKQLESAEDTRAKQILESTTVRVGMRYQTGLLWRSDDIALPDSLAMARQRLSTVERKMNRDPNYAQLYRQQIESYLEKGYATRLSDIEVRENKGRVWYLPHFGVQNINKPGKLRLVFDAAATVDGISLNSALLSGPDLNTPLLKILFKFRMRKIGVCADVAEMFHQVVVQQCDRSAQRFLWRNESCSEPDIYEMCVMTFGATCSPTSAQFIKNVNADQCSHEFPVASMAVKELHYVDDYVASFESEEEAVTVTSQVVEIHRRGGFKLRGFVSNNPAVLEGLGEVHGTVGNVCMEMEANATDKILGLRWCTVNDNFVFAMRFDRVDEAVMRGERRPTKRELLSASMSVYDPFGFLADYMLHTKVMIQNLWRVGVAWDEPIPEPIFNKWQAWCLEIDRIKTFKIPRCYSSNFMSADDIQLHIFADASEEAFAAVGYWRIMLNGNCEMAFAIGKVKCAPVKILSVPRLELQAAVLAIRLYNIIRECHTDIMVAKTIFWTDSRTVESWIKSTERRFRPFVAHRVGEILDSTCAEWWRWIPTKDNVADDATRSKDHPRFDPNSRWIRGPAFLLKAENEWPGCDEPDQADHTDDCPEEIRSKFIGVIATRDHFIDAARFSNLLRLCRACAWALRFIHNTRARVKDAAKMIGELSVSEIEMATEQICRDAQREAFPGEYAALVAGRNIDRASKLLTGMPYLDDRMLMRLFGRTDAADERFLPAAAQRPILLPREHPFTALVVYHHHVKMSHQFEDGVICKVRQKYWVPRLRPLVRGIKARCAFCKLRAAKPIPPVAGQLPADRLTPHIPAFSFTGLDYFGPVNVSVGRRREKRWIAIFTCLTTRAIHMEIAADLSTDACLLCIRNFCNLRGVPKRIRSDCGTNFVGADNEIRRTADFIDHNIVQGELSTCGIDWKMNCPGNPEAGGAWERLVQSTKRILAVTLKEVAPRVETLRSLVIEAANVLNSRPLTNVPVSPDDLEPLTPNNFLLGRVNSTTTAGELEPRELRSRHQWRIHQQLMRHFWKRWVMEYLPELTRRTKYYKEVPPIAIGTLVLICDANQSRGQWLRGRVERVVVGTDGRIRTAEIRTDKGTLRRPVSKLAVLDVDDSESR